MNGDRGEFLCVYHATAKRRHGRDARATGRTSDLRVLRSPPSWNIQGTCVAVTAEQLVKKS